MPEVIVTGSTENTFDTLKTGPGISAEVSGNTVRMGISEAWLRSKVLGSAVYSINGVFGAPDGSFFIHGSECDSWGYVTGGTAFPMGEACAYKTVEIDGQTETVLDTDASGIWLTDLCPACQTCDEVYRIKQNIEQLTVLVNMIKDVELTDTEKLGEQRNALLDLRINGSTVNCGAPWDPRLVPVIDGRQLLQQYITVAHMWNYAVVQNNASFKLEIAPEDTAGFVVQTKRSLPNCDGHWHIRCTVTVEYATAMGDDGNPHRKQDLSVYVPEPSLRFKPFTSAMDISGATVTAEEAALQTLEEVPVPGSTTSTMTKLAKAEAHVSSDPDCTTKMVYTDEIVGRVGGTYELSFKILPFINYVIYDKNNRIISIRGGTVDITGQTVAGNVVYDSFVPDPAKTVRQPIVNPTKQDYLNAKTAPTGSVPFNNIWRINVLWEVGRDDYEDDSAVLFFTPIETRYSSVTGNTVADLPVQSPDDPQREWDDGKIETILHADAPFIHSKYFEYNETKMYTCTGVREPNTQALITGSTIPQDIVIPDPED